MKNKIIALMTGTMMLFGTCAYARDISVTINGEPLVTDVAPTIVNDRTMLPMRAIFEALGAEVEWVGEDSLIFATKGTSLITMKIGMPKMNVQKIDAEAPIIVDLDTAPYIQDDRTMVPVRAIAEALEAEVDWVDETSTVVITTAVEE